MIDALDTLIFSGIYFLAETNENENETFVSARGFHAVAEPNWDLRISEQEHLD